MIPSKIVMIIVIVLFLMNSPIRKMEAAFSTDAPMSVDESASAGGLVLKERCQSIDSAS